VAGTPSLLRAHHGQSHIASALADPSGSHIASALADPSGSHIASALADPSGSHIASALADPSGSYITLRVHNSANLHGRTRFPDISVPSVLISGKLEQPASFPDFCTDRRDRDAPTPTALPVSVHRSVRWIGPDERAKRAIDRSIPGEGFEPSCPRGAMDFKSIASDQFRHPGVAKRTLAARCALKAPRSRGGRAARRRPVPDFAALGTRKSRAGSLLTVRDRSSAATSSRSGNSLGTVSDIALTPQGRRS
jgi:hypothetical protein